MNENQEMKQCPYCGEEISVTAKKCKHCGKWLSEENSSQAVHEVIIENIFNRLKPGIRIAMEITIVVLIIWILFFDYTAAARNNENFWYGQFLVSGILHTLLLIWATLVLYMLRK